MSEAIDRLLGGKVTSGVYQLEMSMRPETICHRVERRGWRCFYLDGRTIFDKGSLLEQVAEVMAFPAYFGHNWDAFEECVTDLTWLEEPAFVLLYDHAAVLVGQHLEVWSALYAILSAATEYWDARSRRFYVVLRNTGNIPQDLLAL